ncbi:MAG: glycosyltransferase family 4 protein [Gammaproteobacteria bacterium]
MTNSATTERPIRVLALIKDTDRPTIETLCGLQRAGCEIDASCPPKNEARELLEAAGVDLVDFEITRRFDREGIGRIRQALIEGGHDILHVFGNRGLQNGLIALRGLPVAVVAYRGRVGNVSFFDPFSWLRYLNPRIDRVVCVSDAVRDYFLSMRPAFLRKAPHRFVRIYKGHDLAWYDTEPADLAEHGIPDDAFVVTSVANYRKHKGIDELVQSMQHLPAELPIHLLLVGKMDSPELDERVSALRHPGRVHRIGYRTDAPAFAAASDAFVLSTTIPEGLPRSVIEAMACRRACIVTDFGGQAELVVDGESGLHVAPGDPAAIARAVVKLFRDPALRQRLGHAARERIATHFNIEQTVAQTLALYRELQAERRAAG